MADREQQGREERGVVARATYEGPLPPASEFARYEKTLPGAAERILTLAEEEARHRRELERRLVEASVQASRWGQILAFLIAMVSLGAVILSVLLEQVAGAIAPAILAITSLVATFVGSRREE